MGSVDVRLLNPAEIELLCHIDRTEQLKIEYRVENGKLVSSDSTLLVPPWDPKGSGDHSVSNLVAFCEPILKRGAQLLGAFRDEAIVGMAIVEPTLRPALGWLALLHVSNEHRRGGVGEALWRTGISIVEDSGGEAIYVSATPTGSAVQFYLKQGCRLAEADEIVPELLDAEPDDIHLLCPVRRGEVVPGAALATSSPCADSPAGSGAALGHDIAVSRPRISAHDRTREPGPPSTPPT